MLDATRIALPRWLFSRGFRPKSNTMSLTTRPMRERELSTFCSVPHCSRSAAFCQPFKLFVLVSNHASAEFVAEQRDDAVLRGAVNLADGIHAGSMPATHGSNSGTLASA